MTTHVIHPRPLVRAAMLLGLSAYFTRLLVTGDLANYVNIRIDWLVTLAALLLAVYGLAILLQPAHACSCGSHSHDASSRHLIMLLPLILGFALPSQPLGRSAIGEEDIQAMLRQTVDMSLLTTSDAAARDPAQLYSLSYGFIPEKMFSTDDPRQFTILDWLRLYADRDDKSVFEGQKADVVGFVVKDPSATDGFIVTRFFMRHCMFDTIPVGIAVRWDDAKKLREDAWVRVQGTFGAKDGRLVINAVNVRSVGQPETPYLYPQIEE